MSDNIIQVNQELIHEVNLKMPKLKGLTFETSIIERYKHRETSFGYDP